MAKSYFRKSVDALDAYVPGFQPKVADYIKLNTNENPYPPSPRVEEAIAAAMARLPRYPDPTADVVRQEAAALWGVSMDNVIAGNGSDELLTLVVRAFVDPGRTVTFPAPTYSLYEVLVNIQDGISRAVPFSDDWAIPEPLFGNDSPLTFLANPNAPSGTMASVSEVARLADSLSGVLVVDEAYADFAEANCMELAKTRPNVIVLRTLSKSYSLAGLRVGYAMAWAELIAGLMKLRDSYNVDCLAAAGAAAALADQAHFRANIRKVTATRERFVAAMEAMGFTGPRSQANFVLMRPPEGLSGREYFDALWQRLILVRWFNDPRVSGLVRISIGSDAQMDRVLAATREILDARE